MVEAPGGSNRRIAVLQLAEGSTPMMINRDGQRRPLKIKVLWRFHWNQTDLDSEPGAKSGVEPGSKTGIRIFTCQYD